VWRDIVVAQARQWLQHCSGDIGNAAATRHERSGARRESLLFDLSTQSAKGQETAVHYLSCCKYVQVVYARVQLKNVACSSRIRSEKFSVMLKVQKCG
jgi:hypothetical protein